MSDMGTQFFGTWEAVFNALKNLISLVHLACRLCMERRIKTAYIEQITTSRSVSSFESNDDKDKHSTVPTNSLSI